jgi:hypothetical protein
MMNEFAKTQKCFQDVDRAMAGLGVNIHPHKNVDTWHYLCLMNKAQRTRRFLKGENERTKHFGSALR